MITPRDIRTTSLDRAIVLAVRAHDGQVDKAGEPYILHPLRVMLNLDTEESRIAGVLHDVVEDSELSLDELQHMGFSDAVVAAVDATTRRDGESYDDFVRRAATDPIGRRVKRADLMDNMDLGRISDPTQKDLDRVEKYRRALAILDGTG